MLKDNISLFTAPTISGKTGTIQRNMAPLRLKDQLGATSQINGSKSVSSMLQAGISNQN